VSSADPSVNRALLAYVKKGRGAATYLLAVQGADASVPIILATGQPVVTIGGYAQPDPTPSVTEFAAMVETGELHRALIHIGQTAGGPAADAEGTES
jgi:hypothetical protein